MPVDLSMLDEDQKKAVLDTRGRILIYAGAGAGKTRVVASRVAHLIDRGVSPSNILCFTFTNKAADEMKARIDSYTDNGAGGIWIGTFHKICAKLLQLHGKCVGISPHFTIYDDGDSLSQVKLILKDMGKDKEKYLKASDIARDISRFKREMKNLPTFEGELVALRGKYYAEDFKAVLKTYQSELRRACALDFDDLIMCTVRMLQDNEEVRCAISGNFHFVHVDEYQDTADIEAELVRLLSSENGNLCVVGDPRQAIYRFKGANFKIIMDFPNTYENVKVHVLGTNYRSSKRIVDVSESLISCNLSRPDYRCHAFKDEPGTVEIYNQSDEAGEGYFIAHSVKYLVDECGINYGDIAVLCRTHTLCHPIERALVEAGVPYQKSAGSGFYSKEEIQCAVDYLRLVTNPRDEAAAMYLLTHVGQGIGKATVDKVRDSARANGSTILEVCGESRLPRISGPAWSGLQDFAVALSTLITMADEGVTLTELVAAVVDLLLPHYNGDDIRVQNLLDLVDHTLRFTAPAKVELQAFLEGVALYDVKDTPKSGMLQLMTIHQAKGLEFPVVFVPALEEGILPHALSLREGDDAVEEERRLCYVAVTRAIDACYLSYTRRRTLNGKKDWPTPSRFLEEVKAA